MELTPSDNNPELCQKYGLLRRFQIYHNTEGVIPNSDSMPTRIQDWLSFLDALVESAQYARHDQRIDRQAAASAAIALVESLTPLTKPKTRAYAQLLFIALFFEVERVLPLVFLALFQPALRHVERVLEGLMKELSIECAFRAKKKSWNYWRQLQRCRDVFSWLRMICICHLERDIPSLVLSGWRTDLLGANTSYDYELPVDDLADHSIPRRQVYNMALCCVLRQLSNRQLDKTNVHLLELGWKQLEWTANKCHFFGTWFASEIIITKSLYPRDQQYSRHATAFQEYLLMEPRPGLPELVWARGAFLAGLVGVQELERKRDEALAEEFTSRENVQAWFVTCVNEHGEEKREPVNNIKPEPPRRKRKLSVKWSDEDDILLAVKLKSRMKPEPAYAHVKLEPSAETSA